MTLSIVTAILDSHEVVRRQLLHYGRMSLPDGVEFVFVDDGSDPPIDFSLMPTATVCRTNNKTPWTEHAARNVGARCAKGDYLFLIDIDYILPEESIVKAHAFTGDRMDIERRFGVLNEQGLLEHDRATLRHYGLARRFLDLDVIPGHRSQFVMRKDLFWKLGGYREDIEGSPHPGGGGAGGKFHAQWCLMLRRKRAKLADDKASVYMFPCGKYCGHSDVNPLGLFHNLQGRSHSV